MTVAIVALAASIPGAVVSLALLRLIGRQARAHARREDLILNQLLHATGKPWQEAPARTVEREQFADSDGDLALLGKRFTYHPEEL